MRYLVLLCAVLPLWASAAVDYQIKITDPDQHLADIQIKMTAEQAGAFSLKLPAWRSGKYQILDLANGVRRFEARLANGQAVQVEKTEKSTWQLQLPAAGDIVVSYQIYANELNQRTRHIDDTHAYINASAFLMYYDAQRKDPVTVSL